MVFCPLIFLNLISETIVVRILGILGFRNYYSVPPSFARSYPDA